MSGSSGYSDASEWTARIHYILATVYLKKRSTDINPN